ncbi:MAG: hypothetical protein HQ558_07415, partial [Candidatus Omnitrophica bacterium]|nr:hypothetical protein [Candidatus Omnitrophota bacterium]
MKNKRLIVGIAVVIAVAISVSFAFLKKETSREAGQLATESESQISYYTCGMHPSVRVSPKEYKKGDVNCPICNMKLIPVHKETAASSKKPKNPRLPSGRENRKPKYYGCGVDTEGKCPHCDSGKADTVCICGGHSFALKGEKINCPVCGKPLKELSDEEADRLKGVVSRVKIKSEYIKRAGVKIEPVRRLHLFKEIRTAGKVAYDPHLAIAQSEFLSSLKAFDRMKEGGVSDIKERALSLVESSKRKLQLLGLSNEQIA